MGSNSFGQIFQITTWGESHGSQIGVVIDGCPAGLEISQEEIQEELKRRAPGQLYTSPRVEKDHCEIVSGVYEGKTTGAPICLVIKNNNRDSAPYESVKELLRPGHAQYTYQQKYGVFDYRGGGRSSARETACRVAAGAIAKKFLKLIGIEIVAYLKQMAHIKVEEISSLEKIRSGLKNQILPCPDKDVSEEMRALLQKLMEEGDSIGAVVEFHAVGVPIGLGDPVYEKLEARLAFAMMSLPATKGFEIGSGFNAAHMRGSEHNDSFIKQDERVVTSTNHSGGTLGGISSGMPIVGRVVFKPTSSVRKPQSTLTHKGETATWQLPVEAKHDPCVAIRAVPVVEAMIALVLADAILMQRCAYT